MLSNVGLRSRLHLSSTNFAQKVVRRLICRGPRLRGHARPDGRLTLLTVDFHCRKDVRRMVRSFRRNVSESWPVVVVANSGLPLPMSGARVVGLGRNLLHGIGLDLGMRFVSTEYTLICDPDSLIVGDLWSLMKPLVDKYGAASIDGGWIWYHPICLAFRTETWKEHAWSFQHNWDRGYDVAGALTQHLGGLEEQALLKRTRGIGPLIECGRPDSGHKVVEVYAEVFSNTHGGSRIRDGRDGFREHEGTLEWIGEWQGRWRCWADAYMRGEATLADFPSEDTFAAV